MRRKLFILCIVLIGAFILGACSKETDEAVNFPTKPITYSIPFDPGGQSDVEARRQQPFLEESLDVKINIQYKPGGGGAVGWSELVTQDPDGYFIAGINIPHIILQPMVNDDTGYETEDVVPVAIFQTTPIGIAVSKDSDIDTLDDLVEKAKENPGSITVAGSGTHSGHHIAFLQLQKLANIEMQYVPFDGAAPSIQAFLGGNTEVILGNSSDLLTYEDEMNILAIGSEETFEPLPNVPTFIEAGYDMLAGIDRGVGVPSGTDEAIIAILEKAFLDIVEDPEVEETMYEEGFEPKKMGHEQSVDYITKLTNDYEEIMEGLIE